MKLYNKAAESANLILEVFESPEALPALVAPIFLQGDPNKPSTKWSFRNRLLCAIARTQDARGFQQWKQVGRNVKKGAKAFHILVPCVGKKEDEGEEKTFVYGFTSAPVFRLEDTEGEDITTGNPESDAWFKALPLREVAEAWNIPVIPFDGRAGKRDPHFKMGEQPIIAMATQCTHTFYHELMHAADYRLGTLTERGQHWRSETVAELGAAVLGQITGTASPSNLASTYAYLQHYAKETEKPMAQAAMECLDRLCKCVESILETAQSTQAVAV